MVDAQRAMLDELMGKERNVPLTERTGRALKYSDAEICKYELAGLCPYGLFRNTKSDLGPCKYEMHEDDLQFEPVMQQWQQLSEQEQERCGYVSQLHGLLVQLVKDMDRKIERQKERANKDSEPRSLSEKEKEQLAAIKAKEKEATEKAEKLAEDADVDGSQMFAQQAEAFSRQHDALQKQFQLPERTMSVCEVCGVFINSTDNDQRRADHLAGKQYLGWKAIREKLTELDAARKQLPPPPTHPGPSANGREAERDDRRSRDQRRGSEHEHERQHGHRDRERDRERDRDRRGHDRTGREYGRHADHRGSDRERERQHDQRRRSDSHHRAEHGHNGDVHHGSRRHDHADTGRDYKRRRD